MRIKSILKSVVCTALAVVCGLAIGALCDGAQTKAVNPYLPQWEHIPDGEPYIFEDPDEPGKYRVYIYGSHDIFVTKFCGDNLVVWSAPVEDLTDWRYDGVIFEYQKHTLFAPDIALKENDDGTKTYYLYPNDQSNNGVVAKSDRPDGPFQVYATNGVLGFDPGVFVDDDGRAYGYWGFESSYMAELDPDTMCTIKAGTKRLDVKDTEIDGSSSQGPYRFFEASSIRKIEDNGFTKYVFIYSRKTLNGEFGLGECNATLAYAYSDEPLGPWTYGGTIVDARGRCEDENGKPIATNQVANTHGSIIEIEGQWYVFYHRCINGDMYTRQATVEPIDVSIDDNGDVIISEAEVTSQGAEINGLNPYKKYSAGIMCYRQGSSYVKANYDQDFDGSLVCGNKNGSIVGYKYFNFDKKDWQNTIFEMDYYGKGNTGEMIFMLDSPYESKGGIEFARYTVDSSDSKDELNEFSMEVPEIDNVSGKHAVYILFKGGNGNEICDLHELGFKLEGVDPSTPTPVPTEVPSQNTQPSAPAPAPSAPAVQMPKNNIAVGTNLYKVVKNGEKYEAVFAGLKNKKAKKAVIPATIKVNGVVCPVTQIAKKAFSGCTNLKTITIKTLTLKKAGANCFKGINKKAVIKVPKAKYAAYVKLLKKKGQKGTVKIKK